MKLVSDEDEMSVVKDVLKLLDTLGQSGALKNFAKIANNAPPFVTVST